MDANFCDLLVESLKHSALISSFFFTVAAFAVATDLAAGKCSKLGISPAILHKIRSAATLILLTDLAVLGLLVLLHLGQILQRVL